MCVKLGGTYTTVSEKQIFLLAWLSNTMCVCVCV